MTTAADILKVAATQVGYAEDPPGSNHTKFGVWYGLDHQPWCGMFVSWSFFQAGLPLPASTSKGFAYTPAGADWFKRRGRWSTTPAVGDVVFFDFPGDGVNRISHVGIVEALDGDSVLTIEGNTDEAGGRTGGKVMRRRRRVGIVGYGQPDYTALPPSEEDDMKPGLLKVGKDYYSTDGVNRVNKIENPEGLAVLEKVFPGVPVVELTPAELQALIDVVS